MVIGNKSVFCLNGGDELDGFRCFLANFSATLERINFGFICIGFLALIILISIFGRIKENYRWFILNQAIWDLLINYNYICHSQQYEDANANYWNTCIYTITSNNSLGKTVSDLIVEYISSNTYCALFLLSFSRFLSLYFPKFYDILTRGRRIFCTIIFFNFVMFFIHIDKIFDYLHSKRYAILYDSCLLSHEAKNLSTHDCDNVPVIESNDFLLKFIYILYQIFLALVYLKPLICLLLSLFAVIILILKIVKQAKFQLKHNRYNFFNSLRITVVIGLQSLINVFVFSIEFVKYLEEVLDIFFYSVLVTNTGKQDCEGNFIYFLLPQWFDGSYGLTFYKVHQAIIQSRIFIETLIILFIMIGYREAIIDFIVFIFTGKNRRPIVNNRVVTRVITITPSPSIASFN